MKRAANNRPTAPVELDVERIGAGGDGIARLYGGPVFLPFTVPGDRVRARLDARRGGGRHGQVVELLVAGDRRATPPCRHFGSCGGCALQHLDPALYRTVKLDNLRLTFERAGIDPRVIAPLRTVAAARRRTRLGLECPGDPNLPVRIGFRERFRHDLVDLQTCLVLEPGLMALVGALRALICRLLQPGTAGEAAASRTDSGLDLLLEMPAPPTLDGLEALAALAEERDLCRVIWRSAGADTLVVERRPVRIILSGVAVPFPPGAFLQASQAVEQLLVAEVLDGIGSRRPALDLFAGLGVFAFALAAGGPVHAVEGDGPISAALAQAAAGQYRVTVERRDLARNPLPPELLRHFAAAVFDPPRSGAGPQAAAIAASQLDTVMAVSCNPATFARDARTLIAGGFHLDRVTPIDQFMWTPHLELAALFKR